MIKKHVFIGFLVGLIANTIGLILAIFIFGNGEGIIASIQKSIVEGFFGKLISIGAVLNLIAFFLFIKFKQDYRARGVILATVVIAIVTFFINFM